MELPLTVTDSRAGVERDLLVRCDPTLPVGDLVSAMSIELNGNGGPESPTAVPVYLGARRLDATESVGRAGLLPGAVLTVGGSGVGTRKPDATAARRVGHHRRAGCRSLHPAPGGDPHHRPGCEMRCRTARLRDVTAARIDHRHRRCGNDRGPALFQRNDHQRDNHRCSHSRPTRRPGRNRRVDPDGTTASQPLRRVRVDRRWPSPVQQTSPALRGARRGDLRAATEAREGPGPSFQHLLAAVAPPPHRCGDMGHHAADVVLALQPGLAGDAGRQLRI